MKTLAIDIETYSSVSLQKAGVYAYAASPDFEILLFGYAWDDGPVEVIDMAQGQKLLRRKEHGSIDKENAVRLGACCAVRTWGPSGGARTV